MHELIEAAILELRNDYKDITMEQARKALTLVFGFVEDLEDFITYNNKEDVSKLTTWGQKANYIYDMISNVKQLDKIRFKKIHPLAKSITDDDMSPTFIMESLKKDFYPIKQWLNDWRDYRSAVKRIDSLIKKFWLAWS